MWSLLALLIGCTTQPTFIVEGTVVEVQTEQVVIDHDEIAGFMGAMTMPFDVSDPALLEGLEPGDKVVGRLVVLGTQSRLEKIRVTGKGPPPVAVDQGPASVAPRQLLPATSVELDDGSTATVGEGNGRPMALTFLYTRCPIPEFCPLTITRLLALQAQITSDQQILAVTLDPDFDTAEVLRQFAQASDADPEIWRFARVADEEALRHLAMRASMSVARGEKGDIVHGLRLLVLDGEGRLIERYDDNRWPLDRVVQQLTTGGPPAPIGSSGTVTPAPE